MRRHLIQQAGTAPSLLTLGLATSAAGQFGSRSDPWSLNCSSSGAPNVVMDRVVQNLQREGQIADPSRDVVAPLMRDVPTLRGHGRPRSEEHTSELQSRGHLVCRLLLEKNNNI